jgi:hypothetical protein
VSYGRVDIERLLSYAAALLSGEVFERAHVVQAVGQLDQHHADVVDHGQEHLAHVERLPLLVRRVVQLGYLGETVDQVRHLRAEVLFDHLERDVGVFDYVVQQPGGHADGVQLELRQYVRHFERVDQIGLARLSDLTPVLARGKQVGLAQQLLVRAGVVLANLFQNSLESNHMVKGGGGREPLEISSLKLVTSPVWPLAQKQ